MIIDQVLIVLHQVTLAEEVMAKNATISPDREQVLYDDDDHDDNHDDDDDNDIMMTMH